MALRITALVDHEPGCRGGCPGASPEWGASLYIQDRDRTVLFDTGTSGLFADNARVLGLSLDGVAAAVLSHAHLDHGGGLTRFLAENASAPVVARGDLDADLWLDLSLVRKRVGLDPELVRRHGGRFRLVDRNTEILPGVHIVTDVPAGYPTPRGNRLLFRRDGARLVP